jgi:hypothetical protein
VRKHRGRRPCQVPHCFDVLVGRCAEILTWQRVIVSSADEALVSEAVQVGGMPCPGALDDFVQAVHRSPPQNLLGQSVVGEDSDGVACPTWRQRSGNTHARNAFGGVEHLPHRRADAGAQIDGDRRSAVFEISQSQQVGGGEMPIVRHALGQLMPNDDFPDAGVVGGWWNRQNNPEVDLVAVDNAVHPQAVAFVGSVKWRDKAPFDRSDLADLARVASLVPGADSRTPLVAVSRSGFTVTDLAATFTPDTLLAAWRRTGAALL